MYMRKHYEEIHQDIVRELTIFENNEDKETTNDDWLEIFYNLLVRVQNEILFDIDED